MIRKLTLALMLSGSVLAAQAPAFAQTAAPVSKLVEAVNIPHEKFTLDNGLTVLVHEDRKAPIVAVSIWYGVGSKNEPKGKTGYAHLFEHIMFNGSENAPGDYFEYTKKIGATDLNGTTWLDRTNYFQTVPTTALESALFLESDRMGYLLNAVSKEKLDNQIGVVSNEKRQGDNQPFGLVDYKRSETLFPVGHPYHHDTIGSLEDLSAASLDDMKNWFIDHYGPNNAVLVLAGDINAAQAKPLVEKWFGSIKRGKDVAPVNAPVPTLEKPVKIVMKDKVPTTRIYRNWVVPGLADPDANALYIGMSALGGLSSSRLDNILVREEQSATIARGREAVEKLLQREGKTATRHEDLASNLGFASAEDLFEAVGKDEFVKPVEISLEKADGTEIIDKSDTKHFFQQNRHTLSPAN